MSSKRRKKQKAKKKSAKADNAWLESLQTDSTLTRKAWLDFLPLGLLVSVVYWLTLCPFIPGGDSGELIVVSHRLGVAHPPGYPLYTMLAHLFTYIPVGSIAWRVNLFSAVCSLGATFLLFLIVRRWLKNTWVAYFAAGLFAFSPLIWRYSIVAEVFALNNLFVALLLYILLRFHEAPSVKWALLFAFFSGLGLSHHHTLLLAAFPMAVVAFITHKKLLFRPRVFASGVGLFVLGLLPYAYLPWASAKKLLISWGDLTSWKGFLTHFLRKEYGTFQLATGDETSWNVVSNLWNFVTHVPAQFLWIGFLFVALGIWVSYQLWRQEKRIYALTLLVGAFSYILIFNGLANLNLENRLHFDIHTRFWMMPVLFFCIFAALGLKFLASRVPQVKDYRRVLVPAVVVVMVAVQIVWHYRIEDQSSNDTFDKFGRALLGSLPQQAIYLARGDIYVNTIRYLQASEGFRPDVRAIPYDLLWWPWMGEVVEERFPDFVVPGRFYRYDRRRPGSFTLRELIGENIDKHPVYIGKLREDEMKRLNGHYKLLNLGFLHKVLRWKQEPDVRVTRKESAAFDQFLPPQKHEIRDRSWEAFVYYNFWERHETKIKETLKRGTQGGVELSWIHYGAFLMERTLKLKEEDPPLTLKNLGVAYQILSQQDDKYHDKMVDVWKRYLETEPQGPDVTNIRQVVEAPQ